VLYDYLVLASGASHSYFGNESWESDAPGLKSIDNAIEIRRRIMLAFEDAERNSWDTGKTEPVNFTIIGGGPTGDELAGTIRDISTFLLKHEYRPCRNRSHPTEAPRSRAREDRGSFVNGRVNDVKTEYSQDYVLLHPSLTEIVLKWSKTAVPTEEGWVFANPITHRPYYPTEIQKRHLRPAGCCVVECPTCGAATWCLVQPVSKTGNGARMVLHETRVKNAGKYGTIGWHTFRHTYRSWLDETEAPMKVQQELMRHVSIQMTMNVYG